MPKTTNEIMAEFTTPEQWSGWLYQWKDIFDISWATKVLLAWVNDRKTLANIEEAQAMMGGENNYDGFSLSWNRETNKWEAKIVFINYKGMYRDTSFDHKQFDTLEQATQAIAVYLATEM